MAVFQAASDETGDAEQVGFHLTGGFVAPVIDWIEWFSPAWEERVLNGPPVIPYMHMVDIRSDEWRARHGLTLSDAERRVDEAIRVIGSLGSLFLVTSHIDLTLFKHNFDEIKVARALPQPKIYRFEPDFLCYAAFVFTALEAVYQRHPTATRLDFVMERKQGVTQKLLEQVAELPAILDELGRPELSHLVGEFIPGSKNRVPLQAADVACWHVQRSGSSVADAVDKRRYRTICTRPGLDRGWPLDMIPSMAQSAPMNRIADPFAGRKKRRQP